MTATREPLLTPAGIEAMKAVTAEFADALMRLATTPRTTTKPELPTVAGIELHVGDVIVQPMPNGTVETHTIDHFTEYPQARTPDGALRSGYCSGHARIVFCTDGWRHSCADTETFHIQQGEQ